MAHLARVNRTGSGVPLGEAMQVPGRQNSMQRQHSMTTPTRSISMGGGAPTAGTVAPAAAGPIHTTPTLTAQPSPVMTGSLRRQGTMRGTTTGDPPRSPMMHGSSGGGTGGGSPTGTGTISNSHQHHYHYHLYQTTIQDSSGDKKDDDTEEHDEREDEELQELMELFPDGIPEELLLDDGSGVAQEVVDENGNLITVIRPRQKAMKNIFVQHDLSEKDIEGLTFFARVYRFLHEPSSSFLARCWSVLMIVAIIGSSTMILLQSMPNLQFLDRIENVTYYIEFYTVCLFTVDYVLKLLSVHSYADCVLPKPLPYNVLLRFCIQPLNVLDVASVVPFWVQYVLGQDATSGNAISLIFRIVRTLRIVRLLKVAQYSRSIDVFFRVIMQAWDALLLLLFFVGFGSIVFGTLIYLCEGGTETRVYDAASNSTRVVFMRPNIVGSGLEESPFRSIPHCFWYVVATLTTVGYGDLVPTTFYGKLVGGATMLSGVIFISTPLVIFGTHFQNEFTKELDRQAFLHKRQEKIKRKQEQKEQEEKRKAKEEADARVAAGGTRYGIDENDPMAAAMGLGGYDASPSPPPLPGAVPASPSGGGSFAGTGKEGENGDMFAPLSPTGSRPFARMRTSVMVRGATFQRGGSFMTGPNGMINGGGQLQDGSIRLGDPSSRASILGGGGGGGGFLQPMSLNGGGAHIDSGCTCPCLCGARNAAASTIPGSGVVGGVRRSVITKGAGGRLSMAGGGPIVSNPTVADNLAASKGMQLAAQILPPKEIAERSAAVMAGAAATTHTGNMSAGHVLEMQAQLDGLRVLVSQLGGLLIAGGAPAPAIASAMMAAVVPPESERKSQRRSLKAASLMALQAEKDAQASKAAEVGIPATVAEGEAPTMRSIVRAAIAQPSSGKLGPAKTPSPALAPAAAPTAAKPRGSGTTLSPLTNAAVAGAKKDGNGNSGHGSWTLPPAATTASLIPANGSSMEMAPLASPSATAALASPLSPSAVGIISSPSASPSATPSPPTRITAGSTGTTAAPSLQFFLPDSDPIGAPLPDPALVAAPASGTSASAAAPPAPTPAPVVPAVPVIPTGPFTIDQITPARPPHSFPPAPADESTIDCTIRLVSSLIDAPKLSEKLLSKPPFRFLHDVVANMVRQRSFPDAYFDAREMDANKLVEIAPKLEFLEKLIDLISIINQTELGHINPKKIVAGLEYENTNQLLQEFAKAAASGITVKQITAMMEAQEAAAAAGMDIQMLIAEEKAKAAADATAAAAALTTATAEIPAAEAAEAAATIDPPTPTAAAAPVPAPSPSPASAGASDSWVMAPIVDESAPSASPSAALLPTGAALSDASPSPSP